MSEHIPDAKLLTGILSGVCDRDLRTRWMRIKESKANRGLVQDMKTRAKGT